jgi:hypothetical protein
VRLFDRSWRNLVWAGVAKAEVEETTKKKIEQLNNVMAKMFPQYPAVIGKGPGEAGRCVATATRPPATGSAIQLLLKTAD